jgi:hypothetical protein
VEKYGKARQATYDNIIQRMGFVCWATNAMDTRSEYVILFFHDKNGYANVPQYYVLSILPPLVHILLYGGKHTK